MIEERREKQDAQRILLIKETLTNAEKSLQTAKSLLAQLETKFVPQKKTYGVAEGGKIIEGSFDGQVMIGMDGRQYPVPANYASKSKLVEGDMLKLVITDDGGFIYKQIGPFKRKHVIGILKENKEAGGYVVEAEGKIYKVLLAAVTYHHAAPNDEIALVIADTGEATWGAIENVLKKADGSAVERVDTYASDDVAEEKTIELKGEEDEEYVPPVKSEPRVNIISPQEDQEEDAEIDEEIAPDLAALEEELGKK